MSNVIDIAAFQQARIASREERATNFRRCVEMARPQARRGAFEPQVVEPEPEPVDEPNEPAALRWRLSQRGNPYVVTDGFHVVVFRRQSAGQWSFRIENLETEQAWFAERHYGDEEEARAQALLAVRQLQGTVRAS